MSRSAAATRTCPRAPGAGCYTHLPSGSRRFVQQLPGALLAFAACAAITFGFRIYVDNFCNFDALYGSIATVALFLFWLFVVSYVLIACAFMNHVLTEHARRRA